MQTFESKIDCQISSGGQTIQALLHLIEIRYNERITFWNGVLELTDDQSAKLGQLGPAPMGVTLPDGRKGFLHFTHGKLVGGYNEIAGVGKPNP